MVVLFDTHVHLDDEQFAGDVVGVIERARLAGVTQLLAVGTTAASSLATSQFSQRFPGTVFAAAGIHPNYAREAQDADWSQIESLARAGRVVALGETGLDRHWDYTPFPLQEEYFDRHLRLAQELDLPFIVHMRDCEADVLRMLVAARGRGPLRGIMHAFSGSRDAAQTCLELGLHLSFAGPVTYKKSDDLRALAASIPPDRILVETDAPFLSPHPRRGQRPNEPAWLVHTASCVAAARGLSLLEFARQSTANARRLFALPPLE